MGSSMANEAVRWGIIGTGHIAAKFAHDLQYTSGAKLCAVASRDRVRAEDFITGICNETKQKAGAIKAYGSYEELAAAKEVDVVYVATPHPLHIENAMLCLKHGKHILVEKPMAVNEHEGARMVQAARQAGVFCMEAVWTRFLPAITEIRKIVKDGELGEIRLVTADFGFHNEMDAETRLFNPSLAGGSLLDVGVYPINFARMVYGMSIREVSGFAQIGKSGVDETAIINLRFEGGGLASLASAISVDTSKFAYVMGTKGRVVIPLFWMAREFDLQLGTGAIETRHFDIPGFGYQFEADEVSARISQGQIESPIMPIAESLEILRAMDSLRNRWELRYPFEW
jgi:dihydrodiol dehydrogenase / D-xylose 1-dehydrogenase (NADP)